ncbi:MAG: helix-turn-helix transcriptional regulator [Deltaproteobacteria bacterium]|nr:helix-turn-helix transcriptional regulator [Deltaproteobacteria bacterium]
MSSAAVDPKIVRGVTMRRASISPIALVEAAYNLELGPAEWLPNLLRAGAGILDLGQGCAATLWAGTSSNGEPLLAQLHAESGPADLTMRFARAAREVDPDCARAVALPGGPRVNTLTGAKGRHPEAHDALTKHLGCRDILSLWAMDPDHHGVGIHIPSATVIEPSRRARERWHMLSVHIAAGHRLRRRLGQMPKGTPLTQIPRDAMALLDPRRCRLEEIEGNAPSDRALDQIRNAAVGVDLARAQLRGGDGCEALRLLEGVIRGRWSIVDWFDADGRRFILALPNAAHIHDPRGLTERELQVATYVGAGESSKLVAYRLGISRSRVSELLRRAMRKLGIETTGQLVIKMRTLLVESA